MNILPTISTLCIEISAVFVFLGLRQIKAKKMEKHRKSMFWAAVFATIFFAIYASRTLFIGNTAFGGPDSLKIFYLVFLIFHISLATIGAVLGIISLVSGYKKNWRLHRKLGPVTGTVWLCNAVTALVVYLLLYVFYSGGETTSLLKAILGT